MCSDADREDSLLALLLVRSEGLQDGCILGRCKCISSAVCMPWPDWPKVASQHDSILHKPWCQQGIDTAEMRWPRRNPVCLIMVHFSSPQRGMITPNHMSAHSSLYATQC